MGYSGCMNTQQVELACDLVGYSGCMNTQQVEQTLENDCVGSTWPIIVSFPLSAKSCVFTLCLFVSFSLPRSIF